MNKAFIQSAKLYQAPCRSEPSPLKTADTRMNKEMPACERTHRLVKVTNYNVIKYRLKSKSMAPRSGVGFIKQLRGRSTGVKSEIRERPGRQRKGEGCHLHGEEKQL